MPAERAWEPQHKGCTFIHGSSPWCSGTTTDSSRRFLMEPGRKMLRTGLASEKAASLRHTDLNLLPLPDPYLL